MPVHFAAVQEKNSWRPVSNHKSIENATTGRDGAENILRGKKRVGKNQREKYGPVYAVVVWEDGADVALALRLVPGSDTDIERTYISVNLLDRYSNGRGPTLIQIDEWFSGHTKVGATAEGELLLDLQEVANSSRSSTERETLGMARIGQGQFRTSVVTLWGNGEACALSGLAVPEMLIASHIKPWRDSTDDERLDPANGLLLAAHIDSLFDRYLLSFQRREGNYYCVLHPHIQIKVSNFGLGLTPLRTKQLNLGHSQRFQRYMSEHFQKFVSRIDSA